MSTKWGHNSIIGGIELVYQPIGLSNYAWMTSCSGMSCFSFFLLFLDRNYIFFLIFTYPLMFLFFFLTKIHKLHSHKLTFSIFCQILLRKSWLWLVLSSKLPNYLKFLTPVVNGVRRFKPSFEEFAPELLLREMYYHISHYWQEKRKVILWFFFVDILLFSMNF